MLMWYYSFAFFGELIALNQRLQPFAQDEESVSDSGIHPRQMCSIDKELVLKFLLEHCHQALSQIIDVPLIVRQEPFPTGDMFAHKEASPGDVCHAFTCLAKEQKSQHETTKVYEIVGCECRSKYAKIVYNSRRKEYIHRFSFLVRTSFENLNILLSDILFQQRNSQQPQKVQKYRIYN